MTTQPIPLMQFEPPTGLLSLLDAVAAEMADKPDENLEDMEEALTQYAEEREERIRAEYETGLLIFETKSAREQYDAFLFDQNGWPVTLEGDVRWILLGEDYWKLREMGAAPPLESETRMEQEKAYLAQQANMQQQQALAMGQQPAPPQPPEPLPWWFWGIVVGDLGKTDWLIMSGRFRKLWKQFNPENMGTPEQGY